jgi:hypothetical protein
MTTTTEAVQKAIYPVTQRDELVVPGHQIDKHPFGGLT